MKALLVGAIELAMLADQLCVVGETGWACRLWQDCTAGLQIPAGQDADSAGGALGSLGKDGRLFSGAAVGPEKDPEFLVDNTCFSSSPG